MRVLVVDDEKLIVKGIRFSLEQDGMEVDCAYDGEEALEKIKSDSFDIVLLDLMLPKLSGLEVCQQVREFSKVPIIMITAKGEDMDKIMGLEYGADDYITKPFNILELKARVRALLRRASISASLQEESPESVFILKHKEITVDTERRAVWRDGVPVELTLKEFDLLAFLMKNPGKIYSRDKLLELVWDYDYMGDTRTVDVHIRRLREKLEKDPASPVYIITKWGVGYYFSE
jgi:DNA-binding response OmpR family regulator